MRSGTTRRPDGSRTDPPPRGPGHLPGARRRRAVRGLGTAVAALAVVALSGCGNPEYRFVSNDERDVVVRVPWNWSRIDPKEVEKLGQTPEEQEAAQDTPEEPGTWLAYFDAAKKPAPMHIVGDNLQSPVVVLRSGDVPTAARSTLTLDQLRDLVFPVSDAGRAQQEVQAQATGQKLPAFKLVSDDEVKTKTASGVHLVFSVGGEVYDQVAVTDVKKTRFHLLLLHCSQQCYDGRKSQIAEITDSFTIKKP